MNLYIVNLLIENISISGAGGLPNVKLTKHASAMVPVNEILGNVQFCTECATFITDSKILVRIGDATGKLLTAAKMLSLQYGTMFDMDDDGIVDDSENLNLLSKTAITHAASPYTVLADDRLLECDVSGGVLGLTLPAGIDGQVYAFKDGEGSAGANNITITPAAGDTIEGAGTYVINTDYGGISLYYDLLSTDWKVLGVFGAMLSPVTSVFARTGAVVAAASDYDASEVDNDSGVVGATVKAALDTLKSPAVFANDSVVLSAADSHKTYGTISGTATDPIVFTLPVGGVAVGIRFFFFNAANKGLQLLCGGAETIFLKTSGGPPSKIQVDENFSFLEILSTGLNSWVIVSASGKWFDVDDPTKFRVFDGNLPGAVTDNFASFDGADNIKDSGSKAADFEPAFSKNTAFNKDFGTSAGTVREGNNAAPSTIQEQVFIPVEDFIDGTVAPSALATLTSGNGKVKIRDFAGTVADEDVRIPWVVPKDMIVADGVKFRVVGFISAGTAPASGEGVVFGLSGYSIGQGDALDGFYGTRKTSIEPDLNAQGVTTQYDHFTLPLSDALTTITDLAVDEIAMFKLDRVQSNANDDYEQEIGVTGIILTYNRTLTASW